MEVRADLAPKHFVEAAEAYIETGRRPGDFTRAVFANDLMHAVQLADHINLPALPHICAWVYLSAPMECRGSYEKVQSWIEAGGLERLSAQS